MQVHSASISRTSADRPFKVFICLHFGTGEGEGGSFALFQGLYPPPREDADSDRVLTGDSAYKTKSFTASGHIPNRFRWPLLTWVGQPIGASYLEIDPVI